METGRHAINDYLDRLERAAQVLPPERRIELLSEIREHIDRALGGPSSEDGEASTRLLLDRLGSPEEIVAAAAEGDRSWPAPPSRRSLVLEISAVVMLTLGSIMLPLIGWLVGVVLLWSSDRWRIREKVLGTLVVPGGLGAFLVAGLLGFGLTACSTTEVTTSAGQSSTTSTCPNSGLWSHVLLPAGFIVWGLAALIVPLVLLQVARRRAPAQAPVWAG